jgi:hypothetical protein
LSSPENEFPVPQAIVEQHSSVQAALPVPHVKCVFQHVSSASHCTRQPWLQVIVPPWQLFWTVQLIVQLVALPHVIAFLHAPPFVQLTTHGIPSGHVGVMPLPFTVITQAPPWHVPVFCAHGIGSHVAPTEASRRASSAVASPGASTGRTSGGGPPSEPLAEPVAAVPG